jgi:hypothetical protein
MTHPELAEGAIRHLALNAAVGVSAVVVISVPTDCQELEDNVEKVTQELVFGFVSSSREYEDAGVTGISRDNGDAAVLSFEEGDCGGVRGLVQGRASGIASGMVGVS